MSFDPPTCCIRGRIHSFCHRSGTLCWLVPFLIALALSYLFCPQAPTFKAFSHLPSGFFMSKTTKLLQGTSSFLPGKCFHDWIFWQWKHGLHGQSPHFLGTEWRDLSSPCITLHSSKNQAYSSRYWYTHLILNCTGFCPSLSLSSIIINKYSLRTNINSYNISGMGCSAIAICIDLAQNLLRVHNCSNAIVPSREILSDGWCARNERSKLVIHCIIRMSSAAILVANRTEAQKSSKYRLIKALKTEEPLMTKLNFQPWGKRISMEG